MATNSPLLQQAEDQSKKILDVEYKKVDLDIIVESMELSPGRKKKLSRTLKKFPKLFGGGLCKLGINLVNFELNKGGRLEHVQAFPIPKAYTDVTKKEIKQFCDIGVLKRANDSK